MQIGNHPDAKRISPCKNSNATYIFQGTAKTCFEHIYCSKIASHCCTVCYNSKTKLNVDFFFRMSLVNHGVLTFFFQFWTTVLFCGDAKTNIAIVSLPCFL